MLKCGRVPAIESWLSVKEIALLAEGRGFDHRPRHTKDVTTMIPHAFSQSVSL